MPLNMTQIKQNQSDYNQDDAEDYIKQVAGRFEETRKLLNEGKNYKY